MSLKSLLAVGESFLATTDDPSPYEVRKGCQLPVFGPVSSPKKSIPIEMEESPQSQMNFEARVKIGPDRRAVEVEPAERRTFLERKRRGGGARSLTQEELRLEQVRVVRNDLFDSDLELAPRRAARSAEQDINPFAPRPIAAMGRPAHEKQSWAARLARLLGLRRRGRP